MPSRQAIFGIANEPDDDNHKLVELFRNRAELKKEFAALEKEKYRLQQLVKGCADCGECAQCRQCA